MYNIYMVGGVNPSEKNSQSAGIMTFPIYGKIQMFQTTNQIFIYNHIYVSCAFPPQKNLLLRFSFPPRCRCCSSAKAPLKDIVPLNSVGIAMARAVCSSFLSREDAGDDSGVNF